MSLTFGFYNSLEGDRKYNAEQLSAMFDGIINDGVFASIGSSLMPVVGSGMIINIGTGKAWFNSKWINNDAILPIELEVSELVLPRIDAIVIEVNRSDDVRLSTIKVIKGTPGSTPAYPTLINTEDVHQHVLCYVRVEAGVTSILQNKVTIKIGTTDCPFITGIIETLPIEQATLLLTANWEQWFVGIESQFAGVIDDWDTWFAGIQNDLTLLEAGWAEDWLIWFNSIKDNQTDLEAGWEAAFTLWFDGIKDQLNGDLAGALQTQINNLSVLDSVEPITPTVNQIWYNVTGTSEII